MTRPQKNNADFFSHDSDMRNSRKIRIVRKRFGNEGYAVFCMCLEVLADCENFRLYLDEIEKEMLCDDFGIESEKFDEILDYFLRLWLLQKEEDGAIVNAHLIERMQPLLYKREAMRAKYAGEKTPAAPKKGTNKSKMTAEQFEKFWTKYPLKVEKKKAKEKFTKLDPSLFDTILSSLDRHAAGRKWKEGIIPHATTFLNGERWNDVVEPFTSSPAAQNGKNGQNPQRPQNGSVSSTGTADLIV